MTMTAAESTAVPEVADEEAARPQAWIDLEADIIAIAEANPAAFVDPIPLNALDEWGI